jgi:hypothetical protein
VRLFGRFASGCPSELELSRAISLGPTAALSAHLAACARCAATTRLLARPRELARELPRRAPAAAALEQTRTALLAALAMQRTRRAPARGPARRRLALAAPLAAAALVLVVWRLAPRPAPRTPTVDVSDATVVARGAARPVGGTLKTGALPDPEAARPADAGPGPGAARVRSQVLGTSLRTKLAGDRREVAAAPTPAEAAFVEAWSAFRARRFAGAITAFGDVVRLDPGGPLAEDARYLRGVALARTGAREAIDDLSGFLRLYPRSAHADDASLLLASQLVEAGRRAEAAPIFRALLQARSADTRAKARQGLGLRP